MSILNRGAGSGIYSAPGSLGSTGATGPAGSTGPAGPISSYNADTGAIVGPQTLFGDPVSLSAPLVSGAIVFDATNTFEIWICDGISWFDIGLKFGDWIISAVQTINSLSGTDIDIAAGDGITVSPSGTTVTIAADIAPDTVNIFTADNQFRSTIETKGFLGISGGIGIGNGYSGYANFTSGSVTISSALVDSSSQFILCARGSGTLAKMGVPYYDGTFVANTSFTIKSSNVLDDNYFSWIIWEKQ